MARGGWLVSKRLQPLKRHHMKLTPISTPFLAFSLFVSLHSTLYAQGISTTTVPDNPRPSPTSVITFPIPKNYVADNIYNLVIYILLFGMITLIIQSTLLWRANGNADDILKNITITLVITLGICALTIGYDQAQISPIIGLFGTIIGFLLGRRDTLPAANVPTDGSQEKH
jgi:hypothetical protein